MSQTCFRRSLCFIILSLAMVLGCSLRAAAQDNVIHLDAAIPDQGNKTIKYSLAWYIGTTNGLPRTVMLTGPGSNDFVSTSIDYVFQTSVFVPRNFTLVVQNGARMRTIGAAYINFFGSIQAGSYQIFDTASDVRMKGAVPEAPFEWWGAHGMNEKPDPVEDWNKFDSGPAIQAAIKSCAYVTGSPGAVYLIKTPINVTSQVVVNGKSCNFYGSQSIGANGAMFMVRNQQNVLLQNMNVQLNGASRFVYVFGSRDVKIEQVFLSEKATVTNYTFVDIHNSYHCFLSNATINGGGPKLDNASIGVLIRSDAQSGGFSVVDNIGIDNTTILHCWTGVLLNFGVASNNILLRNTSIVGMKPAAPGAYYGVRSIGTARADFIDMEGIHMESMPRGITFENSMGYTISVKSARFSYVEQVFNLHGRLADKLTIEQADFRARSGGPYHAFYHLDATVKKLDEFGWTEPYYKIGPVKGVGVIR